MSALLKGFFMGISLIAAIGSQNAYVIRQSVKKERPFVVASVCALCDLFLIIVGSAGLGPFIAKFDLLLISFFIFGAIFLAYYSLMSLKDALGNKILTADDKQKSGNLYAVIIAALGFSLLNPHAWLDTTVLIGTVSASFVGEHKLYFTIGACLASLFWFFSLSAFGTVFSSWLQRPLAWKIINFIIFFTLLYMSIHLFFQAKEHLMALYFV